ncbi:hypothetical protein CRG98_012036 [Punica granatum]|uniref:Uncharacterized protein n=1 Tax=Punica granatum TaxID=22663 RepID=A0A2I0KG30_PUNGR|nr:hypothetical protein CRG98_012036 [Punica granatum]
MGLGPTEDQRLGLGPVRDLTMGLGPTEDQRRSCFAEGRLCCWAIMLPLMMPLPCNERFCFADCRVLRASSSGVEHLRVPSAGVCFVPRVFVSNSSTLHGRCRFDVLHLVETCYVLLAPFCEGRLSWKFDSCALESRTSLRASWRVHAAEVTGCSRKTVASMLSDLLDCPRLRLYRACLIIRHLPHQSIKKGSKTSSRGSVNSCIALRLWSMCPCGQCAPVKDDKEDNALGDYAREYVRYDRAGIFYDRELGYALFVELSLSVLAVEGLDLLLGVSLG